MSATSRKNSFAYAFNGIRLLLSREPNAKLHAIATAVAIAAGIVQDISATRWAVLAMVIGLVWVTEALNTCIEQLCNFSCGDQYHPAIKVIKDISAAAVLIAAIASVAAGVFIFIF